MHSGLKEEDMSIIKEEKVKPELECKSLLNSSKLNAMKLKIREKLNSGSPAKVVRSPKTKKRKLNLDNCGNVTITDEVDKNEDKKESRVEEVTKSEKHLNGVKSTKLKSRSRTKLSNFSPRNAAIQFTEQYLKNPKRAHYMWKVTTRVIEQQKKVIRSLQLKNSKIMKNNELLRAALEDLQNSLNKPGNCYILLKKPGDYVIKWG